MKVKELTKEAKQKKTKKWKFPCLLSFTQCYEDEQLVVLATSKTEGVIMLDKTDSFCLQVEDYTDTHEWELYKGELRLYN